VEIGRDEFWGVAIDSWDVCSPGTVVVLSTTKWFELSISHIFTSFLNLFIQPNKKKNLKIKILRM
jgi:hypothetical protein